MANRPYFVCFAIGVGFFLVSNLLGDVIARVTISDEAVGHAISQHVYYAITGPIGTAVGYQESQLYMTKRMWTAAALSVGFLMFKSVPVLAVCLVAFLIMRRGKSSSPNISLERTREG